MKRGDIYYFKLGDVRESIQGGERPVLIVQNDMGNQHSTTTIVCPITAKMKKWMPTHIDLGCNFGLQKRSLLLCEQIFTINISDLGCYVGTIEDAEMLQKIEKALKISLGID